jgi:phosphopantetheinyl transferase (holo-ACP synthase)
MKFRARARSESGVCGVISGAREKSTAVKNILVSLSHSDSLAAASVVLQG